MLIEQNIGNRDCWILIGHQAAHTLVDVGICIVQVWPETTKVWMSHKTIGAIRFNIACIEAHSNPVDCFYNNSRHALWFTPCFTTTIKFPTAAKAEVGTENNVVVPTNFQVPAMRHNIFNGSSKSGRGPT